MKRTFTKYPQSYVKASKFHPIGYQDPKSYAVLVYKCHDNPPEFDTREEAAAYAESQFQNMNVGKVMVVNAEDFDDVFTVLDDEINPDLY